MDFEPVGSSAVTGAALGHAHKEALAQSTSLARSPVLLVDDALAAVLALGNHRQVVVRSTEKRLLKPKQNAMTFSLIRVVSFDAAQYDINLLSYAQLDPKNQKPQSAWRTYLEVEA